MGAAPDPHGAVTAALEVAAAAGLGPATPTVLQDSNNVVVHLVPHPVVAKVGVRPDSHEVLGREVAVAAHVAAAGAPVAVPVGELHVSPTSALPVSLWELLDRRPGPPDDRALAAALDHVHAALADAPVTLPSWRVGLDHTRDALDDDARMAAMADDDLALLRHAFARWSDDATRRAEGSHRPLHGEPHHGNVVVTRAGPHLVDFEAACLGPREWDLAVLPPGVAAASTTPCDDGLLALLRLLTSARVATWCWARAEHPEMSIPARHHLAVVRAALG